MIGLYVHLAEVILQDGACLAGIAGKLSNVHEGSGRHRGSGGDACSCQQMLLNKIHTPDQKVDVSHRASTHPAIHFYQPCTPGGVLAFHMEDTLQKSKPLKAGHALCKLLAEDRHSLYLLFGGKAPFKLHKHKVCIGIAQ